MSTFTDAYVDLLITQYWEKPKARGEIAGKAATWEEVRDVLVALPGAFDIDAAEGDQLDKVGKIVGLLRDKPEYVLDADYRFYIKVKIAQNTTTPYMTGGTGHSLQDAVAFAFDGLAYVIDGYDMSLTLVASSAIDTARLSAVLGYGLLPKPAGVRYRTVSIVYDTAVFGFDINPFAVGFGAGPFARKFRP